MSTRVAGPAVLKSLFTEEVEGRTSRQPREELRETLLARIAQRQAHVAVIGAGYVGLAVAVEAAQVGFQVLCFDTDASRVEALTRGESYVDGLPSAAVSEVRAARRLAATRDAARLAECEIVIICVPTPVNASREPDLSALEAAAEDVARVLRPGNLIVLESTSYPGTTSEVLQPILERTGLKAGEDFFLAFSPERIDPGNAHYTLRTMPKVVGGIEAVSTEMTVALYSQLVDRIVPVSSAMTAEMIKMYENVFRNVNIAFANEIAQLCERMGIDVWEVIDGAATKPFGIMPFYPGPGLGGHCIPVDPYYLSWKARQYDFEVRFIDIATDINTSMPYYVLSRVMMALNSHGKSLLGSTVLVLGAAYKPDISDVRESPIYKVIPLLQKAGAVVLYNDPHVPELVLENGKTQHLASVPLVPETVAEADCVLILTAHSSYDYDLLCEEAQLIVDTRNALREHRLKPGAEEKIVRL